MRLLMLVHAGPESSVIGTVTGVAGESRAKGHEVTLFLMSTGVMNLAREDFVSLVGDGVNITVCEHNRKEYKAPSGIEGIRYGSQYDLATYMVDCDRFISFT